MRTVNNNCASASTRSATQLFFLWLPPNSKHTAKTAEVGTVVGRRISAARLALNRWAFVWCSCRERIRRDAREKVFNRFIGP